MGLRTAYQTGMQRIFLNVGYELSEKQLRGYFVKFGVLSDLYLPKHANGRNKGYGFATFASSESLALALQHPKHIVHGITVQVKRAGPRPSDGLDTKPAVAKVEHVPFGQGPRIYVGGVHECLTETRLREHFTRWGNILDLYFPGPRGQKRSNYCFVTFDNRRNAERACSESGRNLDGWALESICMADDRKVELNYSNFGAVPLPRPIDSTAASHPAAEVAGRLSYSLGLQLQYQQQLTALQSTMSAAAAHEASRSTQKASRPSTVSPPPAFPAAHAAPPPLEAPSNLYSQSASLYNQLQEQASYLLPEWWLPALNSAEPVGISTPNQALPQEALGRAGQGPYIMGAHGGNIDCCAMLAQQPMMYAAEQERQQPLLAAQMRAIAAGIGVTQAEVGPGPSPPFRGPAVGFGRAPFQYDGRSGLPYGIPEKDYHFSGAAQEFSAFNFPPQGH